MGRKAFKIQMCVMLQSCDILTYNIIFCVSWRGAELAGKEEERRSK